MTIGATLSRTRTIAATLSRTPAIAATLSRSRLGAALVAAAWAGLCALPARAADEGAEAPMSVSYLQGEAAVTARGTEQEHALSLADPLHEGDVVRTGEGARLEVRLATGTLIRIAEQSRVELKTAARDAGSFRARLLLGNLWAKVHKLLGGQTFEVETENGVAGVRGTEFRVEAAPAGGQDLLRVYEGAVQVEGAGGFSHRVVPGTELRFSRAGAGAGPQKFDLAADAQHPFLKWVRERPANVDRPERNKKEKHKERVHERERIHRGQRGN